jgi:hypothetical protein
MSNCVSATTPGAHGVVQRSAACRFWTSTVVKYSYSRGTAVTHKTLTRDDQFANVAGTGIARRIHEGEL